MLKAATIGFGGIAQNAHVPSLVELEKKGVARLVAACDINPEQFSKKLEINLGGTEVTVENYNSYTDLEEMLAKEEIDIIIICLPTFLHAKYTIDMLNRGYNVLCEKPMARNFEDCKAMIKAAETSKGKLMIGQCLRFSDEYLFLKKAIDNNTFGKVKSALFHRLSEPPMWAWENWFMNHERSGGCLMDMHIHDLDIARFLFGEPKAVSCVTADIICGDDVAHSRLIYDDKAVMAIGDWSRKGLGFDYDYTIGFENATITGKWNKMTVCPRDGENFNPEINEDSMYKNELEYLIELINNGGKNEVNPPESSAETIRLVQTLKASADKGGEIVKL